MSQERKGRVTQFVGRCPICRKPAAAEFRPFCSRRCADADLARWLGGSYRVETDEKPETESDPDPDKA
jgi:endogenous inhibitor of DNA gyrase (YacG/DUF329 family)